jgi:nitrate reductase / nitrite oxidoreductase, beta subunit
VLLYDADQIEQAATVEDEDLVAAQREMILDPFDPLVVADARKSKVPEGVITAAQNSPVYRFVKQWRLALPLHPEFRTLPMLFYVPPLLPVVSVEQPNHTHRLAADFFSSLEHARLPMMYMAKLLAGGNEMPVRQAYQRMMAVRVYKRAQLVGDISEEQAHKVLAEAELTPEQAEAIFKLTTQPGYDENYVIPPMGREMAIGESTDTQRHKEEAGFGFRRPPHRGT